MQLDNLLGSKIFRGCWTKKGHIIDKVYRHNVSVAHYKRSIPFFGCCKGNTEKCSVTQGQGIIHIRHFIMPYQSLDDTS